jgi:hypothetical protein
MERKISAALVAPLRAMASSPMVLTESLDFIFERAVGAAVTTTSSKFKVVSLACAMALCNGNMASMDAAATACSVNKRFAFN